MLLASDHHGPLTVWVQVQCCLPFRWSQENEVRLSYHPLRQSSVAPQALRAGGSAAAQKAAHFLQGSEDSEDRVSPCRWPQLLRTLKATSMKPWARHSGWLKQIYHVDICDFTSKCNNLSTLWKKMALSKFSNRGEIYWSGHLLLFGYNLHLLSKSGVITKLYVLKMVRSRSV